MNWKALKRAGVVGVAWNVTHYGVDHYRDAAPLLEKLEALDMFVDIQVGARPARAHDAAPREFGRARSSSTTAVAPRSMRGSTNRASKRVLDLGATGRAFVKLSGFAKFSREPAPHSDAWPFIRALVDAFTLDHCMWASDWPHLRAPARVDYGVLLLLVVMLFPDVSNRRKLLWETPRELFGFAS